MTKELEALERLAMPDDLHIKECKKAGIGLTEDYEVVEQALKRLEAIDNANPSEALKALERLKTMICSPNRFVHILRILYKKSGFQAMILYSALPKCWQSKVLE